MKKDENLKKNVQYEVTIFQIYEKYISRESKHFIIKLQLYARIQISSCCAVEVFLLVREDDEF